MSVYRIGEVRAKEGSVDELREFLLSIVPEIQSSDGCEAVQLYQSQDDPARFLMIETWESTEAHQASVKNIPAEQLGKIRPMLDGSPGGSYFRSLT